MTQPDSQPDTIDRDEPCCRCGGMGYLAKTNGTVECNRCRGRGWTREYIKAKRADKPIIDA